VGSGSAWRARTGRALPTQTPPLPCTTACPARTAHALVAFSARQKKRQHMPSPQTLWCVFPNPTVIRLQPWSRMAHHGVLVRAGGADGERHHGGAFERAAVVPDERDLVAAGSKVQPEIREQSQVVLRLAVAVGERVPVTRQRSPVDQADFAEGGTEAKRQRGVDTPSQGPGLMGSRCAAGFDRQLAELRH
jgi:hypothetical protein